MQFKLYLNEAFSTLSSKNSSAVYILLSVCPTSLLILSELLIKKAKDSISATRKVAPSLAASYEMYTLSVCS
jgi:hypothetical protein